jgi:hypothetical protein
MASAWTTYRGSGCPRRFGATANTWLYNEALVIMPCAITEPDTAEKVKAAVEIAKLANIRVREGIGSG